MEITAEQSRLASKLMQPLERIVSQHSATIAPMLGGGGDGGVTHAALKNDEAVRTVATYCYALLPGVVRLAVKEPAFVSFMFANREKLLGRMAKAP